MTDAAYGGMTLNDRYFCYDACLASSAMILDMRVRDWDFQIIDETLIGTDITLVTMLNESLVQVALANSSSPRVNMKRFSPSKVPGAVRDGG